VTPRVLKTVVNVLLINQLTYQLFQLQSGVRV